MTKKTTKKAVKKAPVKKAAKKAVKKAAKPDAKKTATKTTIAARVDVGFGNNLYIRGEGAVLSWDVGFLMRNLSPYEWAGETKSSDKRIEYKILENLKKKGDPVIIFKVVREAEAIANGCREMGIYVAAFCV